MVYAHLRSGKVVCLDDCQNPKEWAFLLTCGQDTFCRMRVVMRSDQSLFVFLPSLAKGPSSIDMWDLTKKVLLVSGIGVIGESTGNAMSLAVATCAGNNIQLLVGYDDGTLHSFIIDLDELIFTHHQRIKIFPMTVTCLDYNAQLNSVVLGGPNTDLVLIRNFPSLQEEETQIYRISVANEGFSEAVFSPSGKLIITGGWDGKYLSDSWSRIILI